ncbi:flagellar basal body P-ring formation chaperone FlgA [Legionella maioricensis]|uniref:Flagella basal body P-ring formation protein FlgA n=1 Tax=Legionella maioricensis TaxID=2896528 RepID=A0A9X2D3L3_9GAMM|nr:flagellar basal body P-ring formation protein FlgA [Legionella maioricensis]MCL9689017.1 flagellar basal body P-ring formation protein FlgA [Legionella maioricensis]
MKKSILSVFLFFASICLYATQIQSLPLLKDKIEQYVLNELSTYTEGKIQVSANKIDSRLNLKACAENQLSIFNPYQTPLLSSNTMAVKCLEEDNHWVLYVPITITVLKTVLVSKNMLVKGTQVKEEDIYQTEMDTQRLKLGYFTEKNELIGLVCKHDIAADSPFNPYNIELAKLIHKGEEVTIVANNNNLTVSMPGIALNEGALGDTVKVKNRTSKRIIEAQVAGEKRVKVVL